MLIKLFGASLILAAGVFAVTKIKYGIREQISEIEAFLKITDSVKTDILFKKLPVMKCVENLEIENQKVRVFTEKFINFLQIGKDIPSASKKAFENSDLYLKGEELSVVKGFFEQLGQTSYENQLENAMHTMNKLTRRLGEIKKDCEKNERTKCSLVLGATLATVIVLF